MLIDGHKLKPCPFCGQDGAQMLSNVWEGEQCYNSSKREICPAFSNEPEEKGCPVHMVICSYTCGGCGSSTGWYSTEERAIEAWNRREA